MHSHRLHIRFLIAVAAILAAAAIGSGAAGAADGYIPGVTDSSTGVLAELERSDRFIAGATDSSTGVLRELERKGLEPRAIASPTNAGDSGLGDDATVALGAALAAMVASAFVALLTAARRRRVAI